MIDTKPRALLLKLATAVMETVAESGPAPESSIYLALQASLGLTHSECGQLLNAMVGAGLLERAGHQLGLAPGRL
jgi:DNA-binding IclR family transcriptional regulator